MTDAKVKALVLAGFGINCDYETQYALQKAGAETDRVHINRLIQWSREGKGLENYHILAVDGGFAWADDHGAGVLLGLKLKSYLGDDIAEFIAAGKLVIGSCNGFQALVNMGLLPGFNNDYKTRSVALAANDGGTYRDDWVHLLVNQDSPCVFTKGIDRIELPIRHGEGKFYAPDQTIQQLIDQNQVVMRYAKPLMVQARRKDPSQPPAPPELAPADGVFPYNPNGSLHDIAGICDPTGRIFGLMPHPEAFHHLTNHPQWTRILDHPRRWEQTMPDWEGYGLKLFHNAVEYVKDNLI